MACGSLCFCIPHLKGVLKSAGEVAISLLKLTRLLAGNPAALQVDESENALIGPLHRSGVMLDDVLDMPLRLENVTSLLSCLRAMAEGDLRPFLAPLSTTAASLQTYLFCLQ